MNEASVLVVDDERRYRELLDMNLTRRGYRVRHAVDGLSALNAVEAEEPALIVLDIKLPDMDGYEVCRRIRKYSQVPIIMLTARAEPAEKIRGLGVGADDYVTKPFSADELLARVDAVLRRAGSARGSSLATTFDSGELHIDYAAHRVTLRGEEVELTAGEYRLLVELATNAGRVLLQDELLRRVWGPDYAGATALLQTAVRRLRRKIETDPSSPRYVLTKRGVGYQFAQR
jgi:DNA-binding response OmpR family regulator